MLGLRSKRQVPRVLIVEDDPGIGRLLGALLHFEGYEIEDAKDWDDMLFAVEQLRPDLAIVDVHLRTGDGFDLLRQIRTHPDPATARTPVLMMSGMDYRFQCKQAGANGFLEKPFDRMALLEAIRKANEAEPVEKSE
jgi:DNA-binding response OmpR family regulator